MNAIRQAAFLRPISRSSSPGPIPRSDSGPVDSRMDDMPPPRTSSFGALNKLALSSKRSRPLVPADLTPPQSPPPTLVQDGSYLEALSIKLSEGVSKTLALVPVIPSAPTQLDDVFNGRKPIPSGRGRALGILMAGELNAAKDKLHLQRAIVRQFQRPLSVLLTNISAQLLPILSSPKFNTTESVGAPTAAQLHALALAAFSREILQSFDEMHLGMTGFPDVRADGLQGIREGFEHVITRVVNPLVAAIKQDLHSVIGELEKDTSDSWQPKYSTNSNSTLKPVSLNQRYHPAFNILHSHITAHAKILERCLSIGGSLVEHSITSVTISLAWRGLVALAHRKPKGAKPLSRQTTPPSTGLAKKKLTPPSTPRMALAFKPSRPSSPTMLSPTRAADTKALCDLLMLLPRPSAANQLACEAVDDAFEALKALCVLFDTLDTFTGTVEDTDLDVLTEELPTLIALPVLFNAPNVDNRTINESVAELLGLQEEEYRLTCLASFGREEECAETVGRQLLEVFNESGLGDTAIARWLRHQD